ncbi:MAG: AAA family ATPase [Christensenellaceae bacterium]|jgi:thymidine kinase|nr:AAA family ATPase [Christensenellaceae bacterium]
MPVDHYYNNTNFFFDDAILAYESESEEAPGQNDLPLDGECRIMITSRFKNDIGGLTKERREKVDQFIRELIDLPYNKIRERLNTKNAKKFKGITIPTFKFRMSLSERIIYIYGNQANVDNSLIKDGDIIFLAYAINHDDQKNIALEALSEMQRGSLTYDDYKLVDSVKKLINVCFRDEVEFVQPIYFATTDLPILSSSQLKLTNLTAPVIIRGSAGSGKTIVSLEFYKKLHTTVKSIVYLTLTDNMKKHATQLLERNGIKESHCFTFDEFCGKTSIKDKILDKRPERFVEISEKWKRRLPGLTENNIFTYIRGILKGSVLNGERTDFSGLIPFDEWKNLAKKEQLNDDEIREIYASAQAYQKTLEKENRYDDNDGASYLLSNPKKYDCIIVDEVQDLTELQLLAISECCPSLNIYFFGDPNQVINPTIVDFGRIGGIFYRKLEHNSYTEARIPQRVLKETWRCGPHLIDYINNLTKLRQQFIGRQDFRDDADEISMRLGLDESYWACYVTQPDIIDDVLEFVNLSTECVIIVSDDESEIELENRLPAVRGRVFTVQEIKGLEYRDVIIYNLISDNEDSFADMLTGNAKRSTHHRMVFNKYYVACTRAQDRIFICEDKEYSKEIETKFFTEQHILPNDDIGALRNLISETKSTEDWLKEAHHLKKEERYKQAKAAFIRAGDELGVRVTQLFIDYQDLLETCTIQELDTKKGDFAVKFFELREYEKAEELFIDIGNEYGTILTQKCAGKIIPNEKVRDAIKNYDNFNKQAFINLGFSDYLDTETKKITNLIAKIKQLGR